MNEEIIGNIAIRYKVIVGKIRKTNEYIIFDFPNGIPILPFFFSLAEELNVELKNISVEHKQAYDGCPTCGPGSCEFYCEIKL